MFSKIAKSFQPLNTFVKSFILDVWQGSEYASDRVFLSWNRMKNEIATCKFRLLVEFYHWKDFRNLKIKTSTGHWASLISSIYQICYEPWIEIYR